MRIFVFVFMFLTTKIAFGQVAEPCTDGTQNSCTCNTAPIICTFDLLNGFEYDMTTFSHPADGPTPMCPGAAGNNTSSQNPTWFRFAAWCTSMTIKVTYTNCIDGPSCGGSSDFGIQAAVYRNCSLNANSAVNGGCGTATSGCVNNGSRTLNITGLTIGNIYNFLVDGCCGSACHILIEVSSPPCPPTLPPFPGPISGPDRLCVNQSGTFTFPTIVGATKYQWSINGTVNPPEEVPTPPQPANISRTLSFAAAGTYTICVDAATDCIMYTGNTPPIPDVIPICKTITVVDPVDGSIVATPTPVCPGVTVNLSTSGYDPLHTKFILVVNSAGVIVSVISGESGTFTHPNCAQFSAYAFNYFPGTQTAPVVGNNISSLVCTTDCCQLEMVPFSFQDSQAPVFVNPPPNITYACFDLLPPIEPLSYTDNCIPSGSVNGVQAGSFTNCNGGTITRTWTVTDICANTATHTQTITISPIPVATLTVPPDQTVPCNLTPADDFLPPLNFTNNASGGCLITGTIIPTRVENIVNCAGTVTYTWSTTDICNRPITGVQVYTITPQAPAELINAPSNQTIACTEIPAPGVLPPLSYDNGDVGECRIFGTMIPTRVNNIVNCVGTITYIWSTIDVCNRPITHTQILTVQAPPEAQLSNLPPNMTIACTEIPAPGVLPPLSYTNNSSGNCLISGTIIPSRVDNIVNCVGTITYTWQATDFCNRQINHTQVLTVLAPPEAVLSSLPPNTTIPCTDIPAPGVRPPLTFTNNSSGNCLISGTIIPNRVDNIVNCVGTITYTWQFTDFCNRQISHTQILTVVAPPEAVLSNPPASATIPCTEIPAPGVLPPLTYTNNSSGNCLISGTITPTRVDNIVNCVGTITYTWNRIDFCNRVINHVQVLTVLPPPVAVLSSLPASATIPCTDIPGPGVLPPLTYTNGSTGSCLISGSIIPTRVDNIVNCAGTITYTWQATDFCNREISHVQVLTVLPPPQAVLSDLPANATIPCTEVPAPGVRPPLTYTNGSSGACLISGTITPTRVDNIVNCTGTITYTWQVVDFCNRTLTHVQILTVLPPPQAELSSLPPSQTVDCSQVPAPGFLPTLTYTNNSSGACLISGTITPTRVDNITNCQGTVTFTWSATDFCNRQITHTQVLTVTQPPVANIVNPPASQTINCNQIPPVGTIPNLSYTNNETGSCQVDGTMTGSRVDNIVNCEGTITFTWNATDRCGRALQHIQILTILPPPVATLIDAPVYNTPFTCQQAESFVAPQIAYSNNSAICPIQGSLVPMVTPSFSPCGGTINVNWVGQDQCNRPLSYSQIIIVSPAPPPSITGPLPADITVACRDLSSFAIPLNYSNGLSGNCLLSGTLAPVLDQPNIICGGIASISWAGLDQCGNALSHIQNITILPSPPASFINLPPENITLRCDQVQIQSPDLVYTNNADPDCLISGSAPPLVTGSYDACGGLIQYTWQFVDACGRSIVYNQNITVLPSLATTNFETVPVDEELPCGATFPPLVELYYTNNLLGNCAYNGVASPIVQATPTSQTYTWSFIDLCSNDVVVAEQTLTIVPEPNIVTNISQVNICAGQSYDLSTIIVTDLNNNTSNVITYHTGSPATNLNKLSSPIIIANAGQTTYYIKATNSFGCFDEAPFTLNINTDINAGTGLNGTECIDLSPVNLWSYLSGSYNPAGYWAINGTSNVNISNPSAVNFNSVASGLYSFYYIVNGFSNCPNDTAIVNLTLVNAGTYEVKSVTCASNFQTYEVVIEIVGYTPTSNAGIVTSLGSNRYSVSNIPIATTAVITLTSTIANCQNETIQISPPNCNCPNINPPTGPDKQSCINVPATLQVSVDAGLTANWYANAVGGTAVATSTLTYNPPVGTAGIFTFYAEALDPINGCKSTVRTAINLEVLSGPQANNATLSACDDNTDQITSFDLNLIKSSINSNPAFEILFYTTLADANANINAIVSPYTNTVQNQKVYATVKDNNGCISIAEVTLNSLPLPTLNIAKSDEICLDAKNGSISVTSNIAQEFKLNNLPWSANNQFKDLAVGLYTVFGRSPSGCVSSADVAIEQGLDLSLAEFSIVCNNNGTKSESNDDFYSVTFKIINNLGISGNFTVTYKGQSFGNFTYNNTHTIQLAADESSGLLEFADALSACNLTKVVTTLIPCSTDCDITVVNFTYDCDDNNTESESNDDFYRFSLLCSALNGGGNNQYNVKVDGVIYGPFVYNAPITFQVPANGLLPNVIVQDVDKLACFKNLSVDALLPCSGKCVLNYVASNVICNDNGTINDPSDDTFTFDIRVNGLNLSQGWKFSGSNVVRTYNTIHKLGPFNISNGNFNQNISDDGDASCILPVLVQAPNVCSAPCKIEIQGLVIGSCNSNGTGNTEADDFFNVEFTVNVLSGSANFYNVTFGNKSYGPFNYGVKVNIPNLPADNNVLTLVVLDGINAGCVTEVNVSSPPCSSCNESITLSPDVELTCVKLSAVFTATASQQAIFNWTGPNNYANAGAQIEVTTPGTYICTALFPNQCTVVDSVEVKKDANLPVSNAGPDGQITCNVPSATLKGTSNKTQNVTYIWTDKLGNVLGNGLDLVVNTPGEYYFEVIDNAINCASGKDEVIVADKTDKPNASINADPGNTLDCVIGTVLLSGVPQNNVIFSWNVGETFIQNQVSVIIDKAGVITMTATDTITGCLDISQLVIVDLQDYPILGVNPVVPITCATNQTTIDASNSPSGQNLVFEWRDADNTIIPNETSNTLVVNSPGTYYVVLTDTLNGCQNIDTITVDRLGDFPTVSLPDSVVLYCGKKDLTIKVAVLNPIENTRFKWTTNTGSIISAIDKAEVSVQGGGDYEVAVTYVNSGCTSFGKTKLIIDNNIPKAVEADIKDETCINERDGFISISQVEGGAPPYEYDVNDIKNGNLTNLNPGAYKLTIRDKNGCTFDTTFVILPGNDFELSAPSPINIVIGESMMLELVTDLDSSEIKSILWQPSTHLSCDTCWSPILTAKQNIIYEVIVEDIYGCFQNVKVEIRVKDNTIVTAPNVFNPGGNVNKYFTIFGNEGLLLIKKMSIFDRWGNLVFIKENFPPNVISEGWDGTFQKQEVASGVYVYVVEYETVVGIKYLSGDITVLR